MQPELKTNRLLLRNISLDDYENLYEIRFHPDVLKHIKREKIEDTLEMRNFISDRLKAIKSNNLCFWGISRLKAPKLIGTICLWNFNNSKTIAEIGYELHPNCQREGLMNEAMKAVLDFGFETLQLQTIEAFTSKHNDSSKGLLNKFGFSLEANWKDEGFPDNIIYIKHHA